jgi:hypothetical protein
MLDLLGRGLVVLLEKGMRSVTLLKRRRSTQRSSLGRPAMRGRGMESESLCHPKSRTEDAL